MLALSLALLGIAGCGTAHTSTLVGTLRVPVDAPHGTIDPGVFDPARFTVSTPLFPATMLQAGLVKLGPDLHVIPDLAVSIPTITGSGRTYTFTIRQDARFADGQRCTAQSVAASFAATLRAAGPNSLAARYLEGIVGAPNVIAGKAGSLSGLRAIHRLTLRIQLSAPDATFLQKLAFPVASVTKREQGTILGMGAWRSMGVTEDGTYHLRPRPHYYGGPLGISLVTLVPVRSATVALDRYRRGEVDLAWVPGSLVSAYAERTDFHSSPALEGYYAEASPTVARSLAAIDRDRLGTALSSELDRLESIVPPAVPDYVPAPPPTDGAPAPHLSVDLQQDDPANADEKLLRNTLAKQIVMSPVGWPVEIIHRSFLLPDPGRWLGLAWFRTDSSWYRSMLDRAATLTEDPVTRMSMYGDVESWLLRRGTLVPLAAGRISYLVKPAVGSLQVTPLGLMPENNAWSLVTVG